jgi:hypothetical protein
MSEITDIAEEYRRQLNANEKQLLTEIARSWAKVIVKMEGEYKSLLEVVEQTKAKGKPVDYIWLHSLERYRHMKAQAEELTETFADGTVDRVQAMKRADAQLGLDQANDMLGVLAPDSPNWTRLNVSGLENMSAHLADGSPLKRLILESAKESAKDVEAALITGIAIGQNVSHIAWVMSQVSNLPYERAYRIARTEIARAYRSASHEQYKKSGIISGYRRMCYKPTACFACLMMDGEFYPIGQGALQDHPNGKCTPIPVPAGHENDTPRWQTGKEWFAEQTEDDQRKLMGPGLFDAWKQKNIGLRSMVYLKENKIWGPSPTLKRLDMLQNVVIEDGQFGKKCAKHMREFELNPRSPDDREKYKSLIDSIVNFPDEIRVGDWWGTPSIYYRKVNDYAIVEKEGRFITMFRDLEGKGNARFKNAK